MRERSRGKVAAIRCDIRDCASVEAMMEAIWREAPLDVLINNAANDERHATPEVTPETFDERIAVNLRHSFFAAQAVLPGMQA